MNRSLITVLLISLLSLYSCGDSSICNAVVEGGVVVEDDGLLENGVVELTLRAEVDGYESTRSSKVSWNGGEVVDVVYELTSTVSDETIPELYHYKITDAANGTMEPSTDDDKIYYLNDSNNSYFAIYPSGGIADESNKYLVDLTDQQGDIASLDLLYATCDMSAQSSLDCELSLLFLHQYTLVKFNFASGTTFESDAIITLNGAYATAEFNVMSGEFENQEVANISLPVSTSIEVLVLPWQNMTNIELVIYNNGSVTLYKPSIVDTAGTVVVWGAGQQYEYNNIAL